MKAVFVGLVILATAGMALAGGNWSVGFGFSSGGSSFSFGYADGGHHHRGYHHGGYYHGGAVGFGYSYHAPVYVPAPVYSRVIYAPSPVVCGPRVVYAPPVTYGRPVVVAPAYPHVVAAPAVGWSGIPYPSTGYVSGAYCR